MYLFEKQIVSYISHLPKSAWIHWLWSSDEGAHPPYSSSSPTVCSLALRGPKRVLYDDEALNCESGIESCGPLTMSSPPVQDCGTVNEGGVLHAGVAKD